MRKYPGHKRLMWLEQLEPRLSLSSLVQTSDSQGALDSVSAVVQPMDDDPPPGPEPAPPVNPVDGPILYPTLPPSGPLGPG